MKLKASDRDKPSARYNVELHAETGRANNYLKHEGDVFLFDDTDEDSRTSAWRAISRANLITHISIWRGHSTKLQDGIKVQAVDAARLAPIPEAVRVIGMPGPKERRDTPAATNGYAAAE